jgi:hypothetical protein
MTTRERRMSIVILAVLGTAGIAFGAYSFILAPLDKAKADYARLDGEVTDRLVRIAKIKNRQADLDRWKKMSLPADAAATKPGSDSPAPVVGPARPGSGPDAKAVLASREYEEELSKMLRASGYDAGAVTVIPKAPDAKTTPQLANKKPIYMRLLFTVEAKGDLASLVDFLGRFYKLRLLHQIRNLTITKPLDASRSSGPGAAPSTDLTANMTIEALVLDTAEQRKTLLPDKPVDVPPLLARDEKQYAMIAGKNVFFGPPPPPPAAPRTEKTSLDITPYVRLNGITSGPNGLEATLWDGYHNRDYKISSKSVGDYRVEATYTLSGRKRTDSERSGSTLSLKDADGTVSDQWQIVRIDPREVVLRDDAAGKYFALHLGTSLSEMKLLSKDELAARAIKAEPAKPPATDEVDP